MPATVRTIFDVVADDPARVQAVQNALADQKLSDTAIPDTSGTSFQVETTGDADGTGDSTYLQEDIWPEAPVSGEVLTADLKASVTPIVNAVQIDGGISVFWESDSGSEIAAERFISGETNLGIMGIDSEYVYGTPSLDTLRVYAGGLNTGDIIDGGGYADVLQLATAGTLDITAPSYIYGINKIKLSGGDDTLIVSDDRLAPISSVDGGTGFDTVQLKNATVFELTFLDRFGTEKSIFSNVEKFVGSVGADTFYGSAAGDTISGAAGDDIVYGKEGDDTLTGDAGDDLLAGGVGLDTLHGGIGNDIVYGEEDNDRVFGDAGDDQLFGGDGDDHLSGGDGDDILMGESGADSMAGGAGNDTYYVDDTGDIVNENGGGGIDTVFSEVDFQLGAGFENLVLFGGAEGRGNTLDNTITAGVLGSSLYGYSGNDHLFGDAGGDILDGGTGDDVMSGGAGDDIYIVDSVHDSVEDYGDGNDEVRASVSYSLDTVGAQTVENLTLDDAANIDGIGNALDNVITGNSGNNVLDGRGGRDKMIGGLGNDVYIVDDEADEAIEQADGGTDEVRLYADSYSLNNPAAQYIENLTLMDGARDGEGNALNNILTGNSAANKLLGNGGDDTLHGYDGDDTLNGGDGDDILYGGNGDDTYIVGSLGDKVDESTGSGTDLVLSSVSFSLVSAGQTLGNIEYLTLTGTANIDATGNALNNIIRGNEGSNIIDGGIGDDVMYGGNGDDTYYVNSVMDIVDEGASLGNDTIISSVSLSLADPSIVAGTVENLTLAAGSDNLNATGSINSNILTGNDGNNILDGGYGCDIMAGGLGNDVYYVDNVFDSVIEASGGGTDLVYSSASISIAGTGSVGVENITLTGKHDISGSGNALNNILIGNTGGNILSGDAGADTIYGGLGKDTLTGGSGKDIFVFDTQPSIPGNYDKITDFVAADDTIQLSKTVFTEFTETGSILSTAFWKGSAAHDKDDRIIYNTSTGYLYYDADGTGTKDAVLFAVLTTKPAIDVSDFTVI